VRVPAVVMAPHSVSIERRCGCEIGINQSKHSRRIVPIRRSHIALAIRLHSGDFMIVSPNLSLESSRPWAKMLSRSDQVSVAVVG
jgi:hypothetical protein